MEDIFERLVDLNKEITYKFGTEAYDIRCKLYDIIQDGRKKVNNSVLDGVSGCTQCEIVDARNEIIESGYMCIKCNKLFKAYDH